MEAELDTSRLVVGYKQTLKAFRNNAVRTLYLASDAQSSMTETLEREAELCGCEVVYASGMKELGRMCRIHVGASCAAVIF